LVVLADVDDHATGTRPGWDRLASWFVSRGWTPFTFQQQVWSAYTGGRSGLLHAPTGSGKTLAVLGGALIERLEASSPAATPGRGRAKRAQSDPFSVLWITPLRALAADTTQAIERVSADLALPWSVELRTSDTTASLRRKQKDRLPTVLVTTPESLSLLLSYPDARERLASLQSVVVDEWHELLGSKRGVQVELGLARLRRWSPTLRTWGLSATLGHLDEAMDTLLGSRQGELVHAAIEKPVVVETLLPTSIERFPWAGHLGLRMQDAVLGAIERAASTLVFCNTRSHAETWFRTLLDRRPQWAGEVAIHHGSLDRAVRRQVEDLLRAGRLRAVVCTSSLDLGVDFAAVEQVIQVGSPKGVARLMQRAGRSGHSPGRVSRVLCCPTHAFELVEFSAARGAIERRQVERRVPLEKPLDVLVQHLVTIAAGGGFDAGELLAEIRTTRAYRALRDEEWAWVIDFVARGGPSLTAYPRFARITRRDDGVWVVADDRIARQHRLNIGTIVADGMMQVVLGRSRKLGTIEESFIGKLKPGDVFVFAGRSLEFIAAREMTARVRLARRRAGPIPQWAGGRFPLSTQLAEAVRDRLASFARGEAGDPEMAAVAPILAVQQRWSAIPSPGELLIERTRSREGSHAFVYPFLGRLVHEGLAAVLAYRLSRGGEERPVTATFNDYGVELLSPTPLPDDAPAWRALLRIDGLLEDLLACLNAGELMRRQFREISRVAGLVVVSTPGSPRPVRHLQASSALFYDVFREFDPGNLLLAQARREVLERQLEVGRLASALQVLASQSIDVRATRRFTPLAFPIWAQRIQSQTIRVESAQERIDRVLRSLEKAADDECAVDRVRG
jgi:ATP-dependent Lhr-like helicase